MGKGGDYTSVGTQPTLLRRNSWSFDRLKSIGDVKDDILVLRHLWFGKKSGSDHAARLESFYGPQAAAYDKFRARFLWGRRPMLAAAAARLRERRDLVWVDMGGGTGENVDMMSEYLPLKHFKAIYVVDLCHSLCEQAKLKVKAKGWHNVHVVEGDACEFRVPEGEASLITFSYSLSMIPPFHDAVDNAVSQLSSDGLMAMTDFYVSGKYDTPMRQMHWARRFFWRATFDIDNIDIGPERRAYLETKLERVWEINSEGSIPWVPYLRAPYFVWLGRPWSDAQKQLHHEQKVEAPAMFPPTFLYTQSWEDPEPDMKVMRINPGDTVLTLTSGGCNALNLLLNGAGHVVSVDCNPAQSSLLELKSVAIQQLEFEDVWQLFGEGKHPHIERLFETRLAPYLSQKAYNFWSTRLWYFKQGLYYQGGMGKLCWVLQTLAMCIGLHYRMKRLANAPTLADQRKQWDNLALVYFIKHGPRLLVWLFSKLLALLLFNRVVLWFGGGVPGKQYALIRKDGIPIEKYLARTVDGIAENSHLRKSNYFYYNCVTGHFLRDNCPSYLVEDSYNRLHNGLINQLTISTGFFLDELRARKYTKVILMDHVDWLDDKIVQELATTLAQQVVPGGIVIWRSASLSPPYSKVIADAGFSVTCISRASEGYMDRVNMYSSFYMAVRKNKGA
jgi:betaine lipid synthase